MYYFILSNYCDVNFLNKISYTGWMLVLVGNKFNRWMIFIRDAYIRKWRDEYWNWKKSCCRLKYFGRVGNVYKKYECIKRSKVICLEGMSFAYCNIWDSRNKRRVNTIEMRFLQVCAVWQKRPYWKHGLCITKKCCE